MKLKILLALETIFIVVCLIIAIIRQQDAEEQYKSANLQAEAMRVNTEKAEEEAVTQLRIAEEALAESEQCRQMLKECQEKN